MTDVSTAASQGRWGWRGRGTRALILTCSNLAPRQWFHLYGVERGVPFENCNNKVLMTVVEVSWFVP